MFVPCLWLLSASLDGFVTDPSGAAMADAVQPESPDRRVVYAGSSGLIR